ncbi:hypothetical protein [Bathymodiolus platifrons methanotrophic gill symbiont]|uniref:hypothetical protein n=1 Tax=Bathymodiolus platifrons methanotrophic gill symbiont TaxID=113268 RepID=UPI001C8D0300|nr:hypothetical protein [Bathymodiolus platifrons methanotrophic gill symbiont]
MQQGSIWGHGSYLAPDWSADWLHREALELLSLIASEFSSDEQLLEMYKVSLRHEIRKNTYDPHTGNVIVSPNRALAMRIVARHYIKLFTAKDESSLKLRKDYAFPLNSVLNEQDARQLTAFFCWTAWAAVTNRPNQARHATSRNSGTPVAVIRSPTQRIGDAPAALRPPQTEHKAAQSWLPQMALRLFGIKF